MHGEKDARAIAANAGAVLNAFAGDDGFDGDERGTGLSVDGVGDSFVRPADDQPVPGGVDGYVVGRCLHRDGTYERAVGWPVLSQDVSLHVAHDDGTVSLDGNAGEVDGRLADFGGGNGWELEDQNLVRVKHLDEVGGVNNYQLVVESRYIKWV